MNTETKEAFTGLSEDFEAVWAALAPKTSGEARARANFMLAQHCFGFLEWCARVCDANKAAKRDPLPGFVAALKARNANYFSSMPVAYHRSDPLRFFDENKRALLAVAFDLVRNGIGHCYASTRWPVSGGRAVKYFGFSISGAGPGYVRGRDSKKWPHLSRILDFDTLSVVLRPDILFEDVKHAAITARLPDQARPASFPDRGPMAWTALESKLAHLSPPPADGRDPPTKRWSGKKSKK